jgi:photosystem II stability/assembly factor-like uncharacterized protein
MRSRRSALAIAALFVSTVFTAPASAASGNEFASLTYRSIGPAVTGGRITAVAGSEQDPYLYYAGGADGGVFKSVDGGVSWSPVFDRNPVAAIGAIAVSAANANDVWVGTGESNPRNTVEGGDGVWHSTDGGQTWTHAGLDETFAISSISVDPANPRVIVAGAFGTPFRQSTDRGVYRTTDGGRHWRKTLYVDASDGVSDVVRDPANSKHLLAGVWEFHRTPWSAAAGGYRGGIFASHDGGGTWERLRGGGLPNGPTGRIGLAISRTNPKRIYAVIQSKEAAIWRSDDGGKTWIRFEKSLWVGYRGYYFSKIFVDPANESRVLDLETLASRSEDGAASFKLIENLDQYDHHALWWSRDGRRIINGADTGVALSVNGGKTWFTPRDLPVSQVYHVGLSPQFPYTVCVGLQDVNSWCGPGIAANAAGILNRDWTLIAPGDGNYSVFEPNHPEYVWSSETERSAGQVYLTDLRTNQAREISPSQRFSEGMAVRDLPFRFDWMTPIAFTYSHPVAALVGGNVVFQTTDRGQHWERISPDLTRDENSHQAVSGGSISHDNTGAEFADAITSIVTTPLDPSLVWVATDDGLVQVSRDLGAHWSNVTPPEAPSWGRIDVIEAGHGSAGTAYVAVDHHMSNGDERPYLFATEDYGKGWTSISGDLPHDLFVRCIREDPVVTSLLFACTQRGVWASLDAGRHWQSLRLNMPASAVYDIELYEKTRDLVVGTQGRGVYVLDDIGPLEWLATSPNRVLTLLPPRTAYRYFLPQPYASSGAADFVGQNAPYGAVVSVFAPVATSKASARMLDASGNEVRSLHVDRLHAGFNRLQWDLRSNGPVLWKNAPANNAGQVEGPEVVPGAYTVEITAGGATQRQPLVVRATDDDTTTQAQFDERYGFLRGLYDDLSRVNQELNTLDACIRSKCADEARAASLKLKLTAGYQSQLEMVMVEPRLRERILALIERVDTSELPPTQGQLDEAATLHESVRQALQ